MDEQRKYAILFAATILADLELRHFTNAIIANPIASAAFFACLLRGVCAQLLEPLQTRCSQGSSLVSVFAEGLLQKCDYFLDPADAK